MKYKTVYVLFRDSRESEYSSFHGIVCYSYEEACQRMLKRLWYFNPTFRKSISEMRAKEGAIAAYEHFADAWLYDVPWYVKLKVKV